MYFENDKELFKTIGNNLRIFRKKANLTQAQLAESVGISISYLSKMKRVYEKKSVNLIAFYGNIKLIIGGDFLWAERKENH